MTYHKFTWTPLSIARSAIPAIFDNVTAISVATQKKYKTLDGPL